MTLRYHNFFTTMDTQKWWQSFQNNKSVPHRVFSNPEFLEHIVKMLREEGLTNEAILTRILDYELKSRRHYDMHLDFFRMIVHWACREHPEGLLRTDIMGERRATMQDSKHSGLLIEIMESYMEQDSKYVASLLPIYLRTTIRNRAFTLSSRHINLDFAMKHEEFRLLLEEVEPSRFVHLTSYQQLYLLDHDCNLNDDVLKTIWISLVQGSHHHEALERWSKVSHMAETMGISIFMRKCMSLYFYNGDVESWDAFASIMGYDISLAGEMPMCATYDYLKRKTIRVPLNHLLIRYLSDARSLPITAAIMDVFKNQSGDNFYRILDESKSHGRFREDQIAEILHYVDLSETRLDWWAQYYPNLTVEHLLHFRFFNEVTSFIHHSSVKHFEIINEILGGKYFFKIVSGSNDQLQFLLIISELDIINTQSLLAGHVYSYDTGKGFRVVTTRVHARDVYADNAEVIDHGFYLYAKCAAKKSARK